MMRRDVAFAFTAVAGSLGSGLVTMATCVAWGIFLGGPSYLRHSLVPGIFITLPLCLHHPSLLNCIMLGGLLILTLLEGRYNFGRAQPNRSSQIDVIKFVLGCLGVISHMLSVSNPEFSSATLEMFVYPGFALISGFCSQRQVREDEDGGILISAQFMRRNLLLLCHGVCGTNIACLLLHGALKTSSPNFSWSTLIVNGLQFNTSLWNVVEVPWYFVALFIWRQAIPYLCMIRSPCVAAYVVSQFAGQIASFGGVPLWVNLFKYLPLFVLGFKLPETVFKENHSLLRVSIALVWILGNLLLAARPTPLFHCIAVLNVLSLGIVVSACPGLLHFTAHGQFIHLNWAMLPGIMPFLQFEEQLGGLGGVIILINTSCALVCIATAPPIGALLQTCFYPSPELFDFGGVDLSWFAEKLKYQEQRYHRIGGQREQSGQWDALARITSGRLRVTGVLIVLIALFIAVMKEYSIPDCVVETSDSPKYWRSWCIDECEGRATLDIVEDKLQLSLNNPVGKTCALLSLPLYPGDSAHNLTLVGEFTTLKDEINMKCEVSLRQFNHAWVPLQPTIHEFEPLPLSSESVVLTTEVDGTGLYLDLGVCLVRQNWDVGSAVFEMSGFRLLNSSCRNPTLEFTALIAQVIGSLTAVALIASIIFTL